MITTEESHTLIAILEVSPDRFYGYVNNLVVKYYQKGFDTGVNEAIKSITKLIPKEEIKEPKFSKMPYIAGDRTPISECKSYVRKGRVINCICGMCV